MMTWNVPQPIFKQPIAFPRRAKRPSDARIFRPKQEKGAGNAGRSMRPQPRMQNKKSIRA
jgi:hypothetical protein